jgi:hypothetical protein
MFPDRLAEVADVVDDPSAMTAEAVAARVAELGARRDPMTGSSSAQAQVLIAPDKASTIV